ncbi:hypothetical protein ACNQKP_09190 [Bdellovibrio bacteriovorus]|uniref:hypothetical protein n=1 Tax=Bdellovibrio bacteriovorus TaxID=959 RepID=UPI003AA85C76
MCFNARNKAFMAISWRVVGFVLVASFGLSSVGCSDFLNGKKAEPEVIEFSDTRFACLQVIPQHLEKFSVGEAKESEIRQGFDCMTDALNYFNKKTFGSLENAYTVEEMRRFFGKYFLKKNNVTPEFAAELMKIKRALLGGSTSHITKDEIVRLVEILGLLRDESIELSPHVKLLLNQNQSDKTEWEQISAAVDQLRRSLQRLLEKTQIAKSDYSFEDAKKALSGFAEFIRGEEPFAPYQKYSQWVPMVESVKVVLMGRRAHFAGLYQWSESLDTLLDLYELALKYHYVIGDFEFTNAAKVRQTSQFLTQGLGLLLNSHQMKTSGRIPVEDIDNLINQILPSATDMIQPKSLIKTYKAVLMKILDPARVADSRSLLGLEKKHIMSIQRELNIFRLHQSFIDNIPMDELGGGVTQKQLVEYYNKFNKTYVIEKGLTEDAFEQKALENAWADIGELIKNPTMVNFNGDGRLIISATGNQTKQSWAALTKFNLMRVLSRMLMLGYADNVGGRLSQSQMSEKGLVSWYEDFQELGLDLKAFDPRSANSGSRSFLEANFFTFSGNGNDSMDQKETFEFVTTLFSAGLGTSNAVSDHMKLAQCAIEEKDVFGFNYYKEDCFREQLRKHIGVYFANMPGMVNYVRGLNAAQWKQFFDYVLAASVTPTQRAGLIETANVRTMVTILHYIETIMVIYDTDHNQGLSVDEVYASAPRFMSFFKKVNPGTYEFLIKEGFAHLVFYGEIPGAGGIAGFQFKKMWGIDDAQRMEIARLFGTLKDQLNKVEN